MSFLYNYLLSDSQYKDENGNTLTKQANKLRCLSETLANYGGVLSKLSQILCINDENNNIFSDCKPFSKEKTLQFFKDHISREIESKTPYTRVSDVDFNVFKSGSVGQVHRAKYDDKKIIFKVQYVGLAEQTLKDLQILDKIASVIYYFADLKNAMMDIKTKMHEELDYRSELKNHLTLYKIYEKSDYVNIPKILPELCSDNILAMRYAKGKGLKEFINISSQDDRNTVGMNIIKFLFTTIYVHGILYSDVHYGNFLVKKDNSIYVLDFGCLHYMKNHLVENIRKLWKSIRDDKKDDFFGIVHSMGILKNNTSGESREYMYNYFQLQYKPWTSTEFEFTEEWLDKATDKNTELMKEWALPQDIVYMNKIPYCCYYILTKMKVKGKFREIFDEIFLAVG